MDYNTDKEAFESPVKRSLLEMSGEEARDFFLKQESYANFDLPSYFDFEPILSEISKLLPDDANSIRVSKCKPRDHNVNHEILTNKDGNLAWRSFKLIHPVLYVQLVHLLTSEENWQTIISRIRKMSRNDHIECLSIPMESHSKQSDKAEQIIHWWKEVEQQSIALSLEYKYIAYSDVTDCYGQIYTHSIAWSLNGKTIAKNNRNKMSLIGNAVDSLLQDLNQGQTNGIPQGSVLMDFIAEILLSYADLLITIEINKAQIKVYKILRYRDDYRVFTNNPVEGQKILQIISRVLHTLGLKLNAGKTGSSSDVISGSIKSEKLEWLSQNRSDKNLQKHLLILHGFAKDHQNRGILLSLLKDFLDTIAKLKKAPSDVIQLIAIVVDIGVNNPITNALRAAILSSLLEWVKNEEKWIIFYKVKKRFEEIPNNGYMQIWLQRFSIYLDEVDSIFDSDESLRCLEKLCQIVRGYDVSIWNSEWIEKAKIKNIMSKVSIIDSDKKGELTAVIPIGEVRLFEIY